MMKSALFALALMAATATTPATAEIVHITYSGTVIDGIDALGFFGIPGASLAGDVYSATYLFNTSIGTIHSDPFYNDDLGGIGYAAPSPSLGASLTINGFSISVSGIGAGELYGIDYGTFSKSYDWASDYFPGTTNYISNWMTDPSRTIPVSINTPFAYSGVGQGQALYRNMLIDLAPNSIVVSIPGSVPEPSTWALMLLGFAFIAVIINRKRPTAPTTGGNPCR